MVQIKQCCGFISLTEGSLIIGALHLTVFSTFLGFLILVTIEIFSDGYTEDPNYIFTSLYSLCVTEIVFNVLLIVDVNKGRADYVISWMVYNLFVLVLATIGILVYIVLLALNMEDNILAFVVPTISYLVFLAVTIYELRVVYIYLKEVWSSACEPTTSDQLPPPWMGFYLNETKGNYIRMKN